MALKCCHLEPRCHWETLSPTLQLSHPSGTRPIKIETPWWCKRASKALFLMFQEQAEHLLIDRVLKLFYFFHNTILDVCLLMIYSHILTSFIPLYQPGGSAERITSL